MKTVEASDSATSWTHQRSDQQILDHVSANTQQLSTCQSNRIIKLEELKIKIDKDIRELEEKLVELLVARQKPKRRRPKFGVLKLFGTAAAIAYLFLYLPLIPKESSLKVPKRYANTSARSVILVNENQVAFPEDLQDPNFGLEVTNMQLQTTIIKHLVYFLLLYLAFRILGRMFNRRCNLNPQIIRQNSRKDLFVKQALNKEKCDCAIDPKSFLDLINTTYASTNINPNNLMLCQKPTSSCNAKIPLKDKGEEEEETKSTSEALAEAKAVYWRRLGEYWSKRKEYLEKRTEFMKEVGENIREIMLEHETNAKMPGKSGKVETLKGIVNETITVFQPTEDPSNEDSCSTVDNESMTTAKGRNLKKKLCGKMMEVKRYCNGRIGKGCKYPARNLYYYLLDKTGGGF